MKVKTAELSGRALDFATSWAVTGIEANGFTPFSRWWRYCGPLINEFQIFIDPPHEVHKSMVTPDGKPKGCWQSYDTWHATISTTVAEKPSKHLWADFSLPGGPYRGEGETPLIAICRAVVASKLGDEVDIPDELMEIQQ